MSGKSLKKVSLDKLIKDGLAILDEISERGVSLLELLLIAAGNHKDRAKRVKALIKKGTKDGKEE